uniref:Uncharacterized protein n=1 Tax=Anguilla anguilla TaxID=7936 RepID=A0A0E9SQH1_ANGAN
MQRCTMCLKITIWPFVSLKEQGISIHCLRHLLVLCLSVLGQQTH